MRLSEDKLNQLSELVKIIQTGTDKEANAAFDKAVPIFEPFLRTILTRKYPLAMEDDNWQKILLMLRYRAFRDYKWDGIPLDIWLYVCAQRNCKSAYIAFNSSRKRRERAMLSLDYTDDDSENVMRVENKKASSPLDMLEATELVRAVISHLSPLEKKVLEGIAEGSTYSEVALEHGLTHKTVDNAMLRVRRKMGYAAAISIRSGTAFDNYVKEGKLRQAVESEDNEGESN